MKTLNWKNIVLISSIILGAAIFAASFSPATSQGRGSSYMIAGGGTNGQFIWRVNVSTGAVSYCVRRDNSTDEKFIKTRPPFCSAESRPAGM
ncbi:MAG: hypothetical protein COB76_00085 [Alphaproteobacteria bacterium]|nr:MAG: hypothetical protein COB76_00085 [Alphaproteobacteria bacterium]